MIQNIGCQILGIFTTEHLGCDSLLAMLSLLLLAMVKPSRNGHTIFMVLRMVELTHDWSIGLHNDETPEKCNLWLQLVISKLLLFS